jgi:hypothetical protein
MVGVLSLEINWSIKTPITMILHGKLSTSQVGWCHTRDVITSGFENHLSFQKNIKDKT